MQPDWLPGQRQQRLVTLITAVMSRLLFGLSGGLPTGLLSGLFYGLLYGLFYGLLYGLFYGLSGGLKDGLTVGEIRSQSFPNEGTRRSVRNALISGLSFALLGG